jgi:hypothetical protein
MSTREILIHFVDRMKGIDERSDLAKWMVRRTLEIAAEELTLRPDDPLAVMAIGDLRRHWRRLA